MGRREVDRRMDEIVAFSELGHFLDAPVRTYSTGMYMRLGFAVAASLDPEVLLLDEVLAVGDAAFQAKCMARIAEFQRSETTIVFVSHSAAAVRTVCDRAIWLSDGRIKADGDAASVVMAYEAGLAELAQPGPTGLNTGAAFEGVGWRSARVLRVRLTDFHRQADRFVSGEPFRIEIGYEVVEPVDPVVSLTVTTEDGALIAGSDNREQAPASGAMGLFWVAFTVESLPLQEGRFAVTVSLEPPAGGSAFNRWERAAAFTVSSRTRGYGPVALPGEWSVAVTAGGDLLA
jgi:ABC-2 type transport system ATP-binding protein